MLRTLRATLTIQLTLAALALVALLPAGCSSQGDSAIKITGSDTMVNLAQAWVEAFNRDHPGISISVTGGGSGVGIANLCSDNIEIATASRPMKPAEIELAKKNTGREPKEFVVGRDALAIYVNLKNPIDTISIPELAEIYGENGTITKWHDLAVNNAACPSDKIVRICRQNSSGTYAYFKEAVLGEKRDYKQGYTAQSGSADIVALVSTTPCAIGYSGMAYADQNVKMLRVSKAKGEPGIEPTAATALDGTYPISRPLYLYTLGEPTGAVRELIDWIHSPAGQKVVEDKGLVPVESGPDADKPSASKTAPSEPAAKS